MNRLVLVAAFLLPALLARLPLLDGLTYEYAVACALFAAAAGIVLGSRAARPLLAPYPTRFKRLEETPRERARPGLGRGLATLTGACLLASALPIAHGVHDGCAWERGVPVYLFVALPAGPLGLALGFLARVAGGTARLKRAAVVLAGLAACSLPAVAQALSGPRAVFHDLLLGTVAPTGYLGFDETVRLHPADLLHRAASLVLAVALLQLALLVATRRMRPGAGDGRAPFEELRREEVASRRRRALASAAVFLGMAAAGEPFGFGTGRGPLEATLPAGHETPHFVLRYRRGSRVEPLAGALGRDCEWAHARLTEALGLEADGGPRIKVFVYEDAAERERLTGASGYLFAKPWLGEIHTELSAAGELLALPHELAHVLAARFGLPLLRVSLRYGLIEGLAEGVAGEYASRPWRHELVAAALEAGLLPPASELVGTMGFAARDARVSYEAAASFCGFLLRSGGPVLLRRVYAWGDFERVYGATLADLDLAWRGYLEEVPVGGRARAIARRAFDRVESPPFYERACARLGRREEEAAPLAAEASPAVALEVTIARLDAACASGSILERDRALARLASTLARAGRTEETALALARRVELGAVPPLLLPVLRLGAADPSLAIAVARLAASEDLGPGAGGEPESGLPGAAGSDDDRALVLALAGGTRDRSGSAPARGLEDPIGRQSALRIGGCAPALERLEGRLLVRAAAAARRARDPELARVLAENASSLDEVLADDRRDAELELDRLRWEKRPLISPR